MKEKTEISKTELLMMAETVGRIQNELQWIVEFIRTKAAGMNLQIEPDDKVEPE